MFQKSGARGVSLKNEVGDIEELKNKQVAMWDFLDGGKKKWREKIKKRKTVNVFRTCFFSLSFTGFRAALLSKGLRKSDNYTRVSQTFTPNRLFPTAGAFKVDSVMAMTYNEYAQLLNNVNENTGKLYQPNEFTLFDFNDLGRVFFVCGD